MNIDKFLQFLRKGVEYKWHTSQHCFSEWVVVTNALPNPREKKWEWRARNLETGELVIMIVPDKYRHLFSYYGLPLSIK